MLARLRAVLFPPQKSRRTRSRMALRPMRDIDLLFRGNEVDRAQQLMREMGFSQSTAPIPKKHYHLPALNKKVDGMQICFELHRGLYPDCPPYYPEFDFETAMESSRKINFNGEVIYTLNNEETLIYVYQHSCRAPLTYEPYRLINVADLIGFTEKHHQILDFDSLKNKCPELMVALSLMHHVAPAHRWS